MRTRLSLGAGLLLLSGGRAFALGCILGGVSDPVLAPMVAACEALLSGIKADTAQDSTSGSQIATTTVSAHQSNASAVAQSQVNIASEQAQWRFQYGTGQGWMPDLMAGGLADGTQATKDADALWRKMTANDQNWFRSANDASQRLSQSLGAHRYVYCSPQEAAAYPGWCQANAGGYSSGDANAATFTLNRSYGQEETLTGLDYVDLVAPPPTVPDRSKGDIDAALKWAHAQQFGALNGAARVALQRVIAEGAGGSISQANSGPGSASCPGMLSGATGGVGAQGGANGFGG